MHLRRGDVVKRHIPEKNIIAGIKNGKLTAADEISFNGRTWDPLGEHPSFCIFFENTKKSFTKKEDESQYVAELFRRTIAFTADGLLIYGIYKAITILLFQAEIYYQYGNDLILIFLAIAYFSIFESRLAKGKTLGKLLMSIHLADGNGENISFPPSFLRSVFFFLSMGVLYASTDIRHYLLEIFNIPLAYIAITCFSIFCLFYIGNLLFMALHSQKRGLHDLIASCFLVYQSSKTTSLKTFSSGTVMGTLVGIIFFSLIIMFPISYSTNYFATADLSSKKPIDWKEKKQAYMEKMNSTEGTGWTSLHQAAAQGNLDEVKSIIKSGTDVDVRATLQETPLYEAARRGKVEVMKYLLSIGADPNAQHVTQTTPLIIAAEYHQSEAVHLLIENKADIDAQNILRASAIGVASLQGWHDDGVIGEILMDAGAKIIRPLKEGCIPLYCAVGVDHFPFVEALLKKGANPNTTYGGQSILIYAVSRGNLDMAKIILQYKAKINYRLPSTGKSALITAIEKNHWDIVDLLLKHDPDINTPDKDGRTPLIWAKTVRNDDLIKRLIQSGAK
jgi:ankyrin repeat protein/uncharacterized RDD family membrane protein YckC